MILDPAGGTGKSQLAMNMERAHPDEVIKIRSGKTNDMLHYASGKPNPKIVFVDLTRQQQEQTNWQGIEAIKNGDFESYKYNGGKITWTKPPHMVIFSNFPPQLDKLSLDRWILCRFHVAGGQRGLQIATLENADTEITAYMEDRDNIDEIKAYMKYRARDNNIVSAKTWFN
jgi:hypothetical protein